MRDIQEFNIFNTVKVKLNDKGINYLKEYYDKEHDLGIDENKFKEFQLWKFLNMFSNCSTGFDYFLYKIEDTCFQLDYDTTIDVKLTNLGMIVFYDLKYDGMIKNPSEVINIPIGALVRDIGKYIVQGQELPIHHYFVLNTRDIPKKRILTK